MGELLHRGAWGACGSFASRRPCAAPPPVARLLQQLVLLHLDDVADLHQVHDRALAGRHDQDRVDVDAGENAGDLAPDAGGAGCAANEGGGKGHIGRPGVAPTRGAHSAVIPRIMSGCSLCTDHSMPDAVTSSARAMVACRCCGRLTLTGGWVGGAHGHTRRFASWALHLPFEKTTPSDHRHSL